MTGIFPFIETGTLRDRTGTELMVDVPLTVYDGTSFASPSGTTFDATAYVSLKARPHLVDANGTVMGNRRLTIASGATYTIDTVVTHQFMGYLELGLVRNQAV